MCILSFRAVGFTNLLGYAGPKIVCYTEPWLVRERKHIRGSGAAPPSGMQEQRPWGSQWAKFPEAEDIFAFRMPISY